MRLPYAFPLILLIPMQRLAGQKPRMLRKPRNELQNSRFGQLRCGQRQRCGQKQRCGQGCGQRQRCEKFDRVANPIATRCLGWQRSTDRICVEKKRCRKRQRCEKPTQSPTRTHSAHTRRASSHDRCGQGQRC
jgi:hypothetical protein